MLNQSLEFVWQGSNSDGDAHSIFTHVLDNAYNSPEYVPVLNGNFTCPLVSGFDFEGNPSQNPPITVQNIKSRADLLASIIKVLVLFLE
jgi:hypothetical protein